MRPKQWAKAVLVFAAPGAAGVLFEVDVLAKALLALFAFIMASGGTYLINDARDVEADRLHPVKRFRPIAAGIVPVRVAFVAGSLLLAASVVVPMLVGVPRLAGVVACYVLLTSAYSVRLKHVAVIDVGAVAAGFVLRAIGGAAATNVPVSSWFFIVASFGSLFMVTGKRFAEQRRLGDDAGRMRSTLAAYPTEYLSSLRTLCAGATMVTYCLWALERMGGHAGGLPWFELSIVPFIMGVMRYLLLLDSGEGEAPEDLVLGDRVLQLTGLCWLAFFLAGVYG
jgi:decaprenyl-phosphate phosphoribosyltransferase